MAELVDLPAAAGALEDLAKEIQKLRRLKNLYPIDADVAELVDALDSKSSSGNRVGVRFPPSVLKTV